MPKVVYCYSKLKIMMTFILNILLPPLSVFLNHGMGSKFFISIVLTIIGWIPGVIHAFIVND